MSPTPRKPAKPKPATEKQQAALERVLAEGGHAPPPPDVAIRLSAKPPSAAALKKLGIKDPRVAELAAYLDKHGDEIAKQLTADRELVELLATDPSAALAQLKVPAELRTDGDEQARADFLERFRGVKLELPPTKGPIKPPTQAEPVQLSEAQFAVATLIADTFQAAAADPATFASLKADPLSVVTAVAATRPPQGLVAGSPAAASVVADVSAQIAAVYGAPAAFRPPGGTTIRLPRPVKGS